MQGWRAILRHRGAATTAEYAIILALGVAVTVGGLLVLRSTLSDSIASSGSRLAGSDRSPPIRGGAVINRNAVAGAAVRE
jgi:Flp pilus assembly pilin Flp